MKVRSITLRLALTYTVTFAVAIAILGIVVLIGARATLRDQFETRIRAESAALVAEYHTEGLAEVAHAVRDRDVTAGSLDYGLADPAGRPVAGRLAMSRLPIGWSTYQLRERGQPIPTRVLAARLPDGHVLYVGDDLGHIQSLDGIVVTGFALLIVLLIVFGGLSGYLLSRGVGRRFEAINLVAERISEGDLRQRVTVMAGGDDLDHLGMTLNHMLDRITALMESLRQVSNDVAHDLRTPLTRLRQRLESALRSESETDRTAAIEDAIGDLDAALDTFAAILRIAQIESGGRRSGFRRLNLTALALEVVESFAPSAEDDGRSLVMEGRDDVEIVGDSELLTQLIVNLVENSLRHTPVGSAVQVGVVSLGGKAVLRVTDNGPGIPASERDHVFKRFYRLEASRTTPSSGLGLSIVSAIAKLHGTSVVLSDAAPGLEARVSFAIAPAQRNSPSSPALSSDQQRLAAEQRLEQNLEAVVVVHRGAEVGLHTVEARVQVGALTRRDARPAEAVLALQSGDIGELGAKVRRRPGRYAALAHSLVQAIVELGLALVEVGPTAVVVTAIGADPALQGVETAVQGRALGWAQHPAAGAVVGLVAGDVLELPAKLSRLARRQGAVAQAGVDTGVQGHLAVFDGLAAAAFVDAVLVAEPAIVVVAVDRDAVGQRIEAAIEVGAFSGSNAAAAVAVTRFLAGDGLVLGAQLGGLGRGQGAVADARVDTGVEGHLALIDGLAAAAIVVAVLVAEPVVVVGAVVLNAPRQHVETVVQVCALVRGDPAAVGPVTRLGGGDGGEFRAQLRGFDHGQGAIAHTGVDAGVEFALAFIDA